MKEIIDKVSLSIEYCKTPEEIKSAKKLFGEIFSVSEYAEKFYKIIENSADTEIILGKYNGEPVSVVHVIRDGSVSYLYGAGVLSKYRLKGVFRVLIAETVKLCTQKGDKIIFIVPQESFHYDIYKKFDITKEVCKNLYRINEDTSFTLEKADDIRTLYSLYLENGKSPLTLPYELFELYISENDKDVMFIKDGSAVCGYAFLEKDGTPYEIYCKKEGFHTVCGKEVFALAVENGDVTDEIYEALYLD